MVAEIYSDDYMFAAGRAPWHGLGDVVETELTSEDAIKAAKLDWKVDLRASSYHWSQQLQYDHNHYHVVRMDTGRSLGVVGSVYQPVQNEDAFAFFDSVVGKGQAIYHTAGSLFQGKKIWLLAKLPNPILVGGKDPVEQYLLFHHAHNGTAAIRMLWTPVRVVCNNTLQMALDVNKDTGIKIRHTSNVHDHMEVAKKALGFATENFAKFGQVANLMVDTVFTDELAGDTLDRLLIIDEENSTPQRLKSKDKILDLFESGTGNEPYRGTLWGFVNAVTEYADHEKTMRVRRSGDQHVEQRKAENHMDSVLFGSAATFKQKATAEIKMSLLMHPEPNSSSVIQALTASM